MSAIDHLKWHNSLCNWWLSSWYLRVRSLFPTPSPNKTEPLSATITFNPKWPPKWSRPMITQRGPSLSRASFKPFNIVNACSVRPSVSVSNNNEWQSSSALRCCPHHQSDVWWIIAANRCNCCCCNSIPMRWLGRQQTMTNFLLFASSTFSSRACCWSPWWGGWISIALFCNTTSSQGGHDVFHVNRGVVARDDEGYRNRITANAEATEPNTGECGIAFQQQQVRLCKNYSKMSDLRSGAWRRRFRATKMRAIGMCGEEVGERGVY